MRIQIPAPRVILVVALALAPCSSHLLHGATIVLNYKDGDKTGLYQKVDTKKSTVSLEPADPTLGTISAIDGNLKTALYDSNFAKTSKWNDRNTFQLSGTALKGTFYVDVYYAQHSTDLLGGAQIIIRYVRGTGEDDAFIKSLQWLQDVKTTDPNGKEPGAYPDVYNSGYAKGKELPFYYNKDIQTKLDPNTYVGEANIYTDSYNIKFKDAKDPTNLKYDLSFFDWSQREPTNTWSAELFLGSYKAPTDPSGKGTVTIYSSKISWGYNVTIPEPASFALMLPLVPLALVLTAHRNRRA